VQDQKSKPGMSVPQLVACPKCGMLQPPKGVQSIRCSNCDHKFRTDNSGSHEEVSKEKVPSKDNPAQQIPNTNPRPPHNNTEPHTQPLLSATNQPFPTNEYRPFKCTCPYCKETMITEVEEKNGLATFVACCGLCLIGCGLCSWIACCLPNLKEHTHLCSNNKCRSVIAVHRPLNLWLMKISCARI